MSFSPPIDELLRLENQFCFLLYAASHRVTKAYQPLLKRLGLTYPPYLVMLVLWEKDGAGETIGVKGLGSLLELDSGTLTPLLRRLEASGLLERKRSPQDERVVLLSLTDKGRALREHAGCVPMELLANSGPVDLPRLLELRQLLQGFMRDFTPPPEPG